MPQPPRSAGPRAAGGLRRIDPSLSAAVAMTRSQKLVLFALALVCGLLAVLWPAETFQVGSVVLALPFSVIALLRAVALVHFLTRRRPRAAHQRGATGPHAAAAAYPTYSILVPLYREARVVGALLEALRRLDYPASHLEVLFITEQRDVETRAALLRANLAPNMRVLTVPEGAPRTKPRALNYALGFAQGDLVTVYDAEDSPEPGQLKMAAHAFRTRPGPVGCVQARLDVYTPPALFIVKQFTLEYLVLFHVLLPAYQKLGWPMPLGGTSNHFPRALLAEVGGWDPYNVTEDADLGVRLARRGYRVAMIGSTTWEEAPVRWAQWFGQRTRWIKGWMQTYLVHTRAPFRLLRELGPFSFFGFHLVFVGMILSALVHPVAVAIALEQAVSGGLSNPAAGSIEGLVRQFCWFNLLAAYGLAALTGLVTALKRRRLVLAGATLLLPLYWFMISAAAYAAVFELVRRPHYWKKTRHIGAGRERIDAAGRATM